MYISEILSKAPVEFISPLQAKVYETLDLLGIGFDRVDTDEIITMDDCQAVNETLDMKMVKTLFLCNNQKTQFYLFITVGDKPFNAKDFSHATGLPRVSFVKADLMQEKLGVKVGAATIFSLLLEHNVDVHLVLDAAVTAQQCYGCSDGATTSYMKLETRQLLDVFLPHIRHPYSVATL